MFCCLGLTLIPLLLYLRVLCAGAIMASHSQTHNPSPFHTHTSRSRTSSALSRSAKVPVRGLPRTHAGSQGAQHRCRFRTIARAAPPGTTGTRVPGIKIPGIDVSSVVTATEAVTDTSLDLDALETRDVNATSYVSRQRMKQDGFNASAVDSEGLPLVYNEDLIASFWKDRPGELASRWTNFAGVHFTTSPLPL